MSDRPNVLLILTDQQRFDTVGACGSPICRTPNIDALARSGVTCTKAYTPIALCSPARASLFTGVLPHRHGLIRNAGVLPKSARSIPKSIPTLAERLRPAEYACYLEGKWHAGDEPSFERGFDGPDFPGYGTPMQSTHYAEHLTRFGLKRPTVEPLGVGWWHNFALAGRMTGPVEASVPGFLAQRTIDRLEHCAADDRPFLLATCFWGPHAPYLPSEPFASLYDPSDIPPWGNFDDRYDGKPGLYARYREAFLGQGGAARSWEDCAQWAALYFGFVTQIDSQIGRILDTLAQLGLDQNTVVIFSSDHGDLTGAHGGLHDKSAMMVEELYHVPLIVRWPGGVRSGSEFTAPVSTIDIPATVVAAAGLDGAGLDGRDLLAQCTGAVPPRPYVTASTWGNHFAYESRMITDGRWKYIFHPADCDELYDLASDPWEMRNAVGDASARDELARLRGCLIQWCEEAGDPLWDPLINLFGNRDHCGLDNATAYIHREFNN